MTDLAIFLFLSLLLFAIAQGIYVLVFARAVKHVASTTLPDECCPPAAIILCLRGSDPFLSDCLSALFELDYPDYEVWIIVDHAADPSLEIVRDVVNRIESRKWHLRILDNPADSCSLKCSSLVQVAHELNRDRELTALLDADTIPHPNWLRELAASLQADDHWGAVSGLRWYMPEEQNWGSLIRHIWNSAAVVQMYWYGIAWGGSLAIRTDLVHSTPLLERWQRAFCEDTMLSRQLGRHGSKLQVIPSLLMVNRESCTVQGFFDWVQRQLLTARLYHPFWWLIVGHAFSTTILNLSAVTVLIVAWQQPRPVAAAWAAAGFVGFQSANLVWLMILERTARQSLRRRNEPTAWLTRGKLARLFLAVPAVQIIHFVAIVATLLRRTISWRGVTYRIEGPWNIRRLQYQPFTDSTSAKKRATDSL